MSMITCDLIRDLIPLYADNAVSEDSRALVEEHLSGCESCRKSLENCRKTVRMAPETAVGPLKKLRDRQLKKTAGIAAGVFLCTVGALLLFFRFFCFSEYPVFYEPGLVRIEADSGDTTLYYPSGKYNLHSRCIDIHKGGTPESVVCFYLTQSPFQKMLSGSSGSSSFTIDKTRWASRVYYYPFDENTEESELLSVLEQSEPVWVNTNPSQAFLEPQG